MQITSITKEKNMIYFNTDWDDNRYSFDINTAILYGLKGIPLKYIPSAIVSYCNEQGRKNDNPADRNCIRFLITRWVWVDHTTKVYFDDTEKAMISLLDRLDSLNIKISLRTYDCWAVSNMPKNAFEIITRYVEKHPALGENLPYHWETIYREWQKEQFYLLLGDKPYGENDQLIREGLYNAYGNSSFASKHPEMLPLFASYLSQGRLYEILCKGLYDCDDDESEFNFHDYTMATIFDNLMGMSTYLNIPLKKTNNFLVYFGDMYALYKEKKTRQNQEGIKKHQSAVAEKLKFTEDGLTVIIPTTIEEFTAEATAQSNCVARLYMPKVSRGETHVVFIRHVQDTSRSYITCEVNNYGQIQQAYYSFNNTIPCGSVDYNFVKKYRHHLREVWGDKAE